MTATVFVIRNQSGQFLSKQNEWVDAGQSATLYRTVHRDEAVNTVFEISAKDIYLRAELVACRLDDRGAPVLDQQVLDQQVAPSEHATAASDA
jgi:hypothetical protein